MRPLTIARIATPGEPGPCVEDHIGVIPPQFLGMELFFQGLVFDLNNPVLPLPTTNVCTTRYINK